MACFRGKADHFNIEMCDAFNVFATFTVLWESSRLLEEIKIKREKGVFFSPFCGEKGEKVWLLGIFLKTGPNKMGVFKTQSFGGGAGLMQ
ncbi:hypothetical protein NL418_000910 [Escherichia coli]|nr:hypothetical protein NL418_000910 [Escherichia coli]